MRAARFATCALLLVVLACSGVAANKDDTATSVECRHRRCGGDAGVVLGGAAAVTPGRKLQEDRPERELIVDTIVDAFKDTFGGGSNSTNAEGSSDSSDDGSSFWDEWYSWAIVAACIVVALLLLLTLCWCCGCCMCITNALCCCCR